MSRLERLAHRLIHIHVNVTLIMFIFWLCQFGLWTIMMLVVGLDPKPFTKSLLYTIQISHWALVEAAGTAAISSWALFQGQHNSKRIAELNREVQEVQEDRP